MIIPVLVAFLVVALAALALSLNALVNMIRDRAPYVPTTDWAIDWMSKHLALRSGAVVYDLGCGDARVLIALARAFPGIRAIGYERNWWPYLLARWRSRGTSVEIRYGNFFRADLRDADVVFCFLIHSVMGKVERFLRPQIRPTAVVYSYGFRFPDWPPSDTIVNPARPDGSRLLAYRTGS